MVEINRLGIRDCHADFLRLQPINVECLVSQIPVLDFDNALGRREELGISTLSAKSSHSEVFRMRNPVGPDLVTLKIMATFSDQIDYMLSCEDDELDRLDAEQSVGADLLLARNACVQSTEGEGRNLLGLQVVGHVLGSVLLPQFVDKPVAVWSTKTDEGVVLIGYSLPYIHGKAVPIKSDEDLVRASGQLAEHGLYVGNRTESRNAVIGNGPGVKRLIDVELRPNL